MAGRQNGRFRRDLLPICSARGPSEQFWHGQECPLFDVVLPAFPLPTKVSSTLQGALKDSFGEVVVACDMPEPCKFLSLDRCQKRFLLAHKKVDLVPQPVLGLVLQVGDTEKFLVHLVSNARILFSESASRVHVSQP